MPPAAARAGFVREHEVGRLGLQASDQFVEVRLACPDGPDEHGWIGAQSLGVRDGD
jgi:hypothetical protein